MSWKEGKGSASDWIARHQSLIVLYAAQAPAERRTRAADGTMKGATAKSDDGKKRPAANNARQHDSVNDDLYAARDAPKQRVWCAQEGGSWWRCFRRQLSDT